MPKSISNSELTYYRRLDVTRDGAVVLELGLPRVIPRRV